MEPLRAIAVGVDLGQRRDPTAIAVVEQQHRYVSGKRRQHYTTRFVERLPLGTPYPTVAARLREIAANARRAARQEEVDAAGRAAGQIWVAVQVYVDATGVGQPVVDILQESGLRVMPVYFTHGDRRSVERERIMLGKAWLVSRLQSLFQTRRLDLPQGHPEAEALLTELLNYEIRVSEDANDRYGAFRTGAHDDLVTALGLATQDMSVMDALQSRQVLAQWFLYVDRFRIP